MNNVWSYHDGIVPGVCHHDFTTGSGVESSSNGEEGGDRFTGQEEGGGGGADVPATRTTASAQERRVTHMHINFQFLLNFS